MDLQLYGVSVSAEDASHLIALYWNRAQRQIIKRFGCYTGATLSPPGRPIACVKTNSAVIAAPRTRRVTSADASWVARSSYRLVPAPAGCS